MKYKYVAPVAFLLFHLLASAQQIPNGGFETWTNPKQPDGWYTFSSSGFVDLAAKDSTDKVEGAASANIHTGTVNLMTTYEILSLGTADYHLSGGSVVYNYHPVYFPFRPDTFLFAYKYDSPGVDTATANIKLSKGNVTLLETAFDLIKNTSWSIHSLVLSPLYSNANIPDSLLIQFTSSKTRSNFFGIDGSTLHVDDVHFGYASLNTSAQDLANYSSAGIIPNPFSGQLTFTVSDNETATVTLYNSLAQQILQQRVTNSATINTEQLADGIYFYELRNDKGIVAKGKIIRQ